MRLPQWTSARVRKAIVVAVGLAFSGGLVAFVGEGVNAQGAVQDRAKLEATIFTYDGQDFVRTQTTLVAKDGKVAANTKLDHDNPAYKALVQKKSYTGEATIFGRKYAANYAPLMGEDGKLTGAVFVGVPK